MRTLSINYIVVFNLMSTNRAISLIVTLVVLLFVLPVWDPLGQSTTRLVAELPSGVGRLPIERRVHPLGALPAPDDHQGGRGVTEQSQGVHRRVPEHEDVRRHVCVDGVVEVCGTRNVEGVPDAVAVHNDLFETRAFVVLDVVYGEFVLVGLHLLVLVVVWNSITLVMVS